MKKIQFLLFCLFTSNCVFAQNTLKGIVVDAKTGLPLPAVSVYINNSSKGTSTNAAGEFSLDNISVTNFDIVATCIGYETFSTTITTAILQNNLQIKLNPKPAVLDAVIINAYEKEGWKKWGEVFKHSIVGIIDAAEDCEITNKQTLKFVYDKKNNILTAFADEPLIIKNKYLGYELRYDLTSFYTNFKTKIIFYEGYPFFTNLNGSAKKIKKWKERREETYLGSVMHFMRSLYRNKLEENGFEIRVMQRYANLEKQRVTKIYRSQWVKEGETILFKRTDSTDFYQRIMQQSDSLDYVYLNTITADSIAYVVDSTTAGVGFKNHIQVKHNLKKNILTSGMFHRGKQNIYPVSIISLLNNNDIVVYSNGSYYNPSSMLSEGYWGIYEKLSTLLPLDYVLGD
jgi:CarboxypepD_reg-like domain